MKTDYKKIDIYTRRKFSPKGTTVIWEYECSTTWRKTCKEAKKVFCERYGLDKTQVKAVFSKNK